MGIILRAASLVMDENSFALPAVDVIRRWWYGAGHLGRQIEQIESQILVVQSNFSKFHERLHTVHWWYHEYLSSYYTDLLQQARRLRVSQDRLEQARALAANDVAYACKLLVKEVHRAFTEHLATLRHHLRTARGLRSLILRFAATIYQFRNKITLQRRYYLAHGSHPSEKPGCQEGWLSLELAGRVPTFL